MATVNLGHVVGQGVPSGGTAGQILKKSSATNYATEWADPAALPAVEAAVADFAAAYSSSTTYQEGDYCTKDGQLYKRNSWGGSTPAAESWDATHWTAVTMTGELNAEKTARAAADTANATEIGAAEAGLAIVVNGDTAPQAISSGQYLFIKNHSTLATGGYHATAAIASGATISSSNVAADADGIANAINDQIGTLNSNIIRFSLTLISLTNGKGAFNPDVSKGIYILVDNGSTACYAPMFFPSSILKSKEGRNIIISSKDNDYVIIKYANNEIEVTKSSGLSGIINAYSLE